jgi:hypothetical protein
MPINRTAPAGARPGAARTPASPASPATAAFPRTGTKTRTPGLAAKWIAFILSHPAGYLIAPTFIGGFVVHIVNLFVHLFGDYVVWVSVVLMAVVMVVDSFRRGPDGVATWIGLTMPSVAVAMGGTWGEHINGWGVLLRDYIDEHSARYVGDAAEVGLAILFLSLVLYSRHIVYGDNGGPFTHYIWRRYVPNLRRG